MENVSLSSMSGLDPVQNGFIRDFLKDDFTFLAKDSNGSRKAYATSIKLVYWKEVVVGKHTPSIPLEDPKVCLKLDGLDIFLHDSIGHNNFSSLQLYLVECFD